jgi:YD repeat-containing protein
MSDRNLSADDGSLPGSGSAYCDVPSNVPAGSNPQQDRNAEAGEGADHTAHDHADSAHDQAKPISNTDGTFTFHVSEDAMQDHLPNGATTTFTYDSMGRLVQIDEAAHGITAFGYDNAGRAATTFTWSARQPKRTELGRVTTFTWDGR